MRLLVGENPLLLRRWQWLQWRLQAEQHYGFDKPTAKRLAFVKWLAVRRGQHGNRGERRP